MTSFPLRQKYMKMLGIDEMHLLLIVSQLAVYTLAISKRFRRWAGIPSGIAQNISDMMDSPEIKNIFKNSDFVYLLNQGADGRETLAKRLNISHYQLFYLTHSGSGEGFIIMDKERVAKLGLLGMTWDPPLNMGMYYIPKNPKKSME